MPEQFENKATKTDAIDKSKQPSAAPTEPGKGELSEQELDKVAGGIEQVLNIGSQSSGAGAGKVTFNPF
jgi:hypothetical protein